MMIRNMLLFREQLVPGMLHVVDHEGDELNFLLLACIPRAGRPHWVRRGRGAREQAVPENEAEDEQQYGAADAQMEAAEPTEPARSAIAIVIAAILDIVADPARRPTHPFAPAFRLAEILRRPSSRKSLLRFDRPRRLCLFTSTLRPVGRDAPRYFETLLRRHGLSPSLGR